MSNKICILLLTILALIQVPKVLADASSDLAELLLAMNQFSADFSQQISTQDGELIQSASGNVHAQRPSKLRWAIKEPDAQLVVVDGEKMWRYEADLEQVTVENYTASGQAAPSILLSGDVTALNDKFNVSQYDGGFILSPKDSSSLFVQIYVRFADGLIAQLQITDGFEQITEILFSNVDITTEHSSDLYSFTPPEGVDILRND
ncbi:MAG: outer membrane lipoprotein carrier protein [Porticoccus sp.]|jgi:outer membrane lipoprotein carrier protein